MCSDGQFVGVELVQVVGQPRRVGDVLLRGLPQLAGIEVDDPQTLAERGEADAAGVQHDVVLGVPARGEDPLRSGVDRRFHDVRRYLDDAGLAIDGCPTGLENVHRPRVVGEHPRLLQDLERGQMDVLELVVGEDVEAETSATSPPRVGASIHDPSPRIRSFYV